ncbi:MAG: TrmH family RNA methyltransferase [Victivallales bacterium]|jgi:23S rRNA (guanosine2251-2'-O)-methyltransferase|nr:TrmH family RNA methyltransferase [Victivallales bacterium]
MDVPADKTTIRVLQGDRLAPFASDSLPVTVVLDRLRSAHNVGNVFRVVEAVRGERIVTCGYTATPPHPKLGKTARGCDVIVPCEHAATGVEAVRGLRETGRRVYAVETVEGAQSIWDVVFEFPCALVLGNEALGVSADALALCDGFVALPSLGVKNSINVGNCAAVVLYEALHQWLEAQTCER